MLAECFDYNLPEGAIAQHPRTPRDAARVWVMASPYGLQPNRFRQLLPSILSRGDVLVVNNCRTIAGRINGITDQNKQVTVTFCAMAPQEGCFYVLTKPAKHLTDGIDLGKYLHRAEVVAGDNTRGETASNHYITLKTKFKDKELLERIHRSGEMPLPLYIKRPKAYEADRIHYQTIFASNQPATGETTPQGAATATASLHFTPQVIASLKRKGVKLATITLVVGGATFLPIRSQQVEDHPMEPEYIEISQRTVATINTAKQQGRRVIAVGTTSLRALEATAQRGRLTAFRGSQNLFIKRGHKFAIADGLITNFHPPRSSALVLVDAISGLEAVKRAYHRAAYQYGLRFFSYGDCCLFDISSIHRHKYSPPQDRKAVGLRCQLSNWAEVRN